MEARPKITSEMREQLRKPFPPEAISPHPTKTFLSTIKAIYVTERLNDVFGIGRWNIHTVVVSEETAYVLMKGTLEIFDFDVRVPTQYGGHTTTGKNIEKADGFKSAVTDCLSKCASYLEIGLDVFKGNKTPQKPPENKPPKPKEISLDQWNAIKSIGTKKELSEAEVIKLVQFVAKREKIAPRDYKIAGLFLPEAMFQARLNEFLDAIETNAGSKGD